MLYKIETRVRILLFFVLCVLSVRIVNIDFPVNMQKRRVRKGGIMWIDK